MDVGFADNMVSVVDDKFHKPFVFQPLREICEWWEVKYGVN